MFLFQTPRHYGRKWEAPRHRGPARAVSPSTWINDRATGCRNPPPPIEAPARHGSNDQPQSVTRGAQSASGQPPDGQRTAGTARSPERPRTGAAAGGTAHSQPALHEAPNTHEPAQPPEGLRTAGPARSPERPRTGAAAGRATHSRPCTKPRTDQPTRYGPQPLPSAASRIGVGKHSLGQAIRLPQCSVAYPNARNMPQYGRRAVRDGAPGGPRECIRSAPPADRASSYGQRARRTARAHTVSAPSRRPGPGPMRGPGPGSLIRRSGAHSWKLMPKSIEPSVSRKSSDTCPSWKSTSE